MRRLARLGRTAVLGGLAAWALAVAALWGFRRDLIYPFHVWPGDARAVAGPGRVVEMPAPDGTPLAVWVAPRRDGRVILHFGGNAGILPADAWRVQALVEAGHGAVVMNYRGAGGMPGRPSEAAIAADALSVYDRLPEISGLRAGEAPVLYGASLGAAVAVRVAAERPAAAVILAAPFARLCETAEHHYPVVPACLILSDERWDSLDRIARIDAPLLVLHGARDRVIPLAHGDRLLAAAEEPKRLVVFPDAGHDDMIRHGAADAILGFLASLPRGVVTRP